MAIINSIISGGGSGGWTFVKNAYNKEYTLAETGFASWTPSTTAATIVAAVTDAVSEQINMVGYEYQLRWSVIFDAVYNAGATLKAMPIKYCFVKEDYAYRRPQTGTDLSLSRTYNSVGNYPNIDVLFYYNTNGVERISVQPTTSYAIYATSGGASIANSGDTPTITHNSPNIQVKCNSSYFATARASELDQQNSIIKIKCDLYRGAVGTLSQSAMWTDLISL